MKMELTKSFIHSQNQLGEGPLWHKNEGALYWVDIHQKRVERFHLATQQRHTFQFETAITTLGIRTSGGFIVSTADGIGFWDGESKRVELFAHPEADLPDNRFNDGAVGPAGHFWAGSMRELVDLENPPPGSFYRIDKDDLSITKVETSLHISNGLGWSPDHKTFYLTDSPRRAIYYYQFDAAAGEINDQEILLHTPEELGVPDGMTVDAEGCIWSARWGGWKIIRYSPEGEELLEIKLPVEYPTSCTFGGPDLNTLFITSAWTPLSEAERTAQPLAGDIFAVELDVKGQLPNLFAG